MVTFSTELCICREGQYQHLYNSKVRKSKVKFTRNHEEEACWVDLVLSLTDRCCIGRCKHTVARRHRVRAHWWPCLQLNHSRHIVSYEHDSNSNWKERPSLRAARQGKCAGRWHIQKCQWGKKSVGPTDFNVMSGLLALSYD